MLEHITAAALPLVDLLAGAPHPLVVGEGFGGLDEGGAVGGAHVGRQVLQPRGLQVLALRHVQAVLAVLHTRGSSVVDPDPDSMGSLDPDSQSGSGSKRAKMAQKNRNSSVADPGCHFDPWIRDKFLPNPGSRIPNPYF